MEQHLFPHRSPVFACIATAVLVGSRASATSGNTDDHYTFLVDNVTTKVVFQVDTSLGLCTIAGGNSGTMRGHVDLQLHAGGLPLESGSWRPGELPRVPRI